MGHDKLVVKEMEENIRTKKIIATIIIIILKTLGLTINEGMMVEETMAVTFHFSIQKNEMMVIEVMDAETIIQIEIETTLNHPNHHHMERSLRNLHQPLQLTEEQEEKLKHLNVSDL